MPARFCFALAFAPLLLAAACGGKVGSPATVQPDGGSGFDTGVGGGQCVDISLASFDQSCLADSDCVGIYAGTLCPGTCAGCIPNAAINNAGEARYQSEAAGATGEEVCACPLAGVPRCVANSCVECPVGAGGPSGCIGVTGGDDGGIETDDGGVTTFDGGGDDTSDAGTGETDGGTFVNDAGATCVEVDAADYSAACTTTADCTLIGTGELCDGSCDCGGQTPINVAGQAQYNEAISGIMFALCACPAFPEPACSAGVCVSCVGPNPPSACLTNHG